MSVYDRIFGAGTMLYLVGLGLCDATDITVKGLEIVRRASRVYLEAYTSILTVGKEALVRTGSAKYGAAPYFQAAIEVDLSMNMALAQRNTLHAI